MLVAEPKGHARLPGQQADIMPGSPLAVLALVTEIVRERFREANGLAWVWADGETPTATETGETVEEGGEPRKIQIEPSFNEHTEVRNYVPAITVDKGETAARSVVLGNLAGKHLQSGLTGFYAMGVIPIVITCTSDKKGESATLGDVVWFYLLAGRELIMKTFGIHDMSMPTLGRTTPGEKGKTEWVTPVAFSLELPLRWSTKPIAPLLNGMVLKFRQSGETDLDTFLLTRYIP